MLPWDESELGQRWADDFMVVHPKCSHSAAAPVHRPHCTAPPVCALRQPMAALLIAHPAGRASRCRDAPSSLPRRAVLDGHPLLKRSLPGHMVLRFRWLAFVGVSLAVARLRLRAASGGACRGWGGRGTCTACTQVRQSAIAAPHGLVACGVRGVRRAEAPVAESAVRSDESQATSRSGPL